MSDMSIVESATVASEPVQVDGIDVPYSGDEEPTDWFLNVYVCTPCNVTWSSEWDCMVNDRCPSCNVETEPDESDELDVPQFGA